MKVRTALKGDWPSISEVSKISGYEDWINEIGEGFLNSGTVLLAEDETLAGFMKLEFLDDNSAWFSALRVHPDSRRKGVGTSLTDYGLKIARNGGASYARLLIESSNVKSIGLATKLGFSKKEEFRLFSGTFDISQFRKVDFNGKAYVNLGWFFVRFPDYKGSDGEIVGNGSLILFSQPKHEGPPNQTVILHHGLGDVKTIEEGYTSSPLKWSKQIEDFLHPLEGFSKANLYELSLEK